MVGLPRRPRLPFGALPGAVKLPKKGAAPKHINSILKRAGITSFDQFKHGLADFMATIPELKQFSATADKYDMEAVLSGGTALSVILAYVRALRADLKAGIKPSGTAAKAPRSLTAILEGQDVDGLLRPRKGPVKPEAVAALTKELNHQSRIGLVSWMPSTERRYYAIEWDLHGLRSFQHQNAVFGGEGPAQIALGVDKQGKLVVHDPGDALKRFFEGTFDYRIGTAPYEQEMTLNGQFDPLLDGLRIVRLAGKVSEYCVEPSEQATASLMALGESAEKRHWETQARVLHSPNNKLGRRWKKYAEKVWTDTTNLKDTIRLMGKSGYSEVLTMLGLRNELLKLLPQARPQPSAGHDEALAWWLTHIDTVKPHVVDDPGPMYLWTSKNRADDLVSGVDIFGTRAGPMGGGMYLRGQKIEEGKTASILVRATFKPKATKLLDLDAPPVKALTDEFQQKFGTEFVPKMGEIAPLNAQADGKSRAMEFQIAALKLDGAITQGADGPTAVVNNAAVFEKFESVHGVHDALLSQLNQGSAGKDTQKAVRALLALKGQDGLKELSGLMKQGKVSLEQLFLQGEGETFFELLPFVDANFAQQLEATLAQAGAKLDANQRGLAQRAISFLRGDLPTEGARQAG